MKAPIFASPICHALGAGRHLLQSEPPDRHIVLISAMPQNAGCGDCSPKQPPANNSMLTGIRLAHSTGFSVRTDSARHRVQNGARVLSEREAPVSHRPPLILVPAPERFCLAALRFSETDGSPHIPQTVTHRSPTVSLRLNIFSFQVRFSDRSNMTR